MALFNVESERMAKIGDFIYFDGEQFAKEHKYQYYTVKYEQTIVSDVVPDVLYVNNKIDDLTFNGDRLPESFKPTDPGVIYHTRIGLMKSGIVLYIRYPESRIINRLQKGYMVPTPGNRILGLIGGFTYDMIPRENLPKGLDTWFEMNVAPGFAVWNSVSAQNNYIENEVEKIGLRLYSKALKIEKVDEKYVKDTLEHAKKTGADIKLYVIPGPDKIIF